MPSQVTDILAQLGANAARSREEQGQIWGQVAAGLGQIPNQIQANRYAEIERTLREQGLAQHIALTGERLRDAREARIDRELFGQAMQPPYATIHPETGYLQFDQPAVQRLMAHRPDAYAHFLDFAEKNTERVNKIQSDTIKLDRDKHQWRLENLERVTGLPEDQQPAAYERLMGGLGPLAPHDEYFRHLPREYPGKQALDAFHNSLLSEKQRYDRAVAAVDLWHKRHPIVHEGAKVLEIPEGSVAGGEITGPLRVIAEAPKIRSLSEQLLEAITKGDKATANRITETLKMEAEARRDPDLAATAVAMRNLSIDLAKERLEKLRKEKAPLDLAGRINTTMGGRQYVNLAEFQTPEDRRKAEDAAVKAGVMPVDKEVASMLADLDTARQNQQTMLWLVESKLPKDASGRVIKGSTNTLEKFMQTDPDLAAIGTFRNAAIQTMRAVAGSKGLRINRYEVELAIENDIPKLTDTIDTARSKLRNLAAFMENIEVAHLVRDRSKVKGALVGDPRIGEIFEGYKILKVEPVP